MYNSRHSLFYIKESEPGTPADDIPTSPTFKINKEIPLCKSIFLTNSEYEHFQIDNEGNSPQFPDSHFDCSNMNSGYIVTRYMMPPRFLEINKPTILTHAEMRRLRIDEDGNSALFPHSHFQTTETPYNIIVTRCEKPLMDIEFDKPITISYKEARALLIDHKGYSSLYPDSRFHVSMVNGGHSLIRHAKLTSTNPYAFDTPFTISEAEHSKLFLDNNGFTDYFPQSYFKIVDVKNDAYTLIQFSRLAANIREEDEKNEIRRCGL